MAGEPGLLRRGRRLEADRGRGHVHDGGDIPWNCSGGVLSSNPIGASGMLRFLEVALQVRGEAGEHQVDGARRALGQAYGGGSQFFAMWVVERRQALTPGPAGMLGGAKPALTSRVQHRQEVSVKVVVDFDECASNAVCMGILPEVFEVRDDGFLYVLNEHPPEELREVCARRSTAARRAPSRSRTTDAGRRRTPPGPGCAAALMTDPPPPPGPLRPVAHRLPPRRQRPGGAVQLALRPPARGHVRPADRGHRRRAQPRGVGRRDPLRAGLAGHGARRGPLPPVGRRGDARRRPSTRCGTAAPSTPATAPGRRSTRAPRRAPRRDPTPGYDGYCRDRGLPRGEGRALRFRTPDEGVVHGPRPDPGRRRVPPARAIEDFVW